MGLSEKPQSTATVLAVWLRPLADYLERTGHSSRDVFSFTGLDVDQVFVPGVRLKLRQAAPLWKHAAEVTGKPFIGLEVASYAPPLQADAMGIAMMASRNCYEAVQRMARLSHVTCDAVDTVIERKDGDLHMHLHVHPEDQSVMPAEAMDPAFLITLGLVKEGMIDISGIRQLRFGRPHPGTAMVEHLFSLFPIKTTFGHDHYSMVIDWHQAQQQSPYWNPALARISEELVLQDLQNLSESNIVSRVRKVLLDQLASGTPHQEKVASLLNVTTRNLQRKLKQRNTSFSELLQQIRQEQALKFLQDPNMTMIDISLSLGFSDQSNFVKAFKGWHGETPGQYRKRLLS